MCNRLDRIVKEYSKLSFNKRVNLKEVYYNRMEYYAKNKNVSIPPHVKLLENYFTSPKNFKKEKREYDKISDCLKDNFLKEVQSESSEKYFKDNIPQAMLYECIESLRRSIFWFINYRYNNRTGFLIAAKQARYYSEFFGFISLSRFLGVALTLLPIVKKIETKINWKDMKIEITKGSKTPKNGRDEGGMHKAHFQLLKTNIKKNSFIPANIKKELRGQGSLFLSEERSSMVYAFGNEGRVSFEELIEHNKNNNTNQLSHCFLGGENGKGILNSPTHENTDPAEIADEILSLYDNEGHKEHIIGDYQYTVISLLKKINIKSKDDYFYKLSSQIKKLPQYIMHNNEKADLLSWI